MCSMAAVWQMYGYQDYSASDPPVCAFKVHSGAQLKDFIQQKEVTNLQIYYNQPDVIDVLSTPSSSKIQHIIKASKIL